MRISDWSSDVCSSDLLDAIRHFAVAWLRNEQNGDLAAFGVSFDVYFLESSLYADGMVEETVRELVAHGHTYEDGGALWLRTTDFGDDKDRVMRTSDGRSEEHPSELQSLMRISYAVFCLKHKKNHTY